MPSRYEKYVTHHTSRRTDGWDYTQPAAYFVTLCTQDRACLFGEVRQGRMMLNRLGRIVVAEWKQSEEIRDRVHLDVFVVMPNHLHGIVVFADPDVDAPTCPRGYRAFGTDDSGSTEGTGDSPSTSDTAAVPSDSPDPSNDENASTGGSDDQSGSENPNDEKASHRRATLAGSDGEGNHELHRPPRSLGSFIAGFKSAATKRINRHRNMPGAAVWQRNYHDRIIRSERHWRNARAYIRRNPADWGGDRFNRDRPIE